MQAAGTQQLSSAWRLLTLTAEGLERLDDGEAAQILSARSHVFSALGWDWRTALLLTVGLDPPVSH